MPFNARTIMRTVSYIAFCAALLTAALPNANTHFILLLLSFGFLSNYAFHAFLLYERHTACMVFSVADILIIFAIARIDVSGASMFLCLFVIGDAVFSLYPWAAAAVVAGDFGTCAVLLFLFVHGRMVLFLHGLFLSAAGFMLLTLIFVLIRRLETKNRQLADALRQSTVANCRAQARGRELESAYEQAVQVSAANERNRIAREIHDPAGHTLTTVWWNWRLPAGFSLEIELPA